MAAAMGIARARAVLGLPRGQSSTEDVKTAFRAQALKWHPDLNPAPEAQERFQEAKQAMDVALVHASAAGGGAGAGAPWPGAGPGATRRPPPQRPPERPPEPEHEGQEGSTWGTWRSEEAPLRRHQQQERQQRQALKRDRLRRRKEELCDLAQKAAAQVEAEAARLGLRRGALLASAPGTEGVFRESVVLLLRVCTREDCRGVVVSGGAGGPVSGASAGWAVFHAQAGLAGADPEASLGGASLFAEERLTAAAAAHLRGHLEASGLPAVAIRGHAEWRAAQLLDETRRGAWSIHSWSPAEAERWLRDRSSAGGRPEPASSGLWRRLWRRGE